MSFSLKLFILTHILGSSAVLGLPQPVCHKMTEKGVPLEQAVEFQRLRPGSGTLSVNISMDGPTQVSLQFIKLYPILIQMKQCL